MDIYTLNRANRIQEDLKILRNEREIWEYSKGFCGEVKVTDGDGFYYIRTSFIDFNELKSRTIEYINTRIKSLEEEFRKLWKRLI